MSDLKIIIVDEKSALQSFVSDVVSFGCLVFLLWANKAYLMGSWMVELFTLGLFVVIVARRGSKKIKKMSPIEARKYLNINYAD